ncbi:glycosyltransferase family 2 protein [Acidobacteriota bacterium]
MTLGKESQIKIQFIIVTWNRQDQLKECLHSLVSLCRSSHKILVVDNASDDGTLDMIKNQFPQVLLIENDKNMGFSKANNLGIKFVSENNINSKYTIFFNNDASLIDNSIENLIEYLDQNDEVKAAIPAVFLDEQIFQIGIGGYNLSLKTAFSYFFGFSILFPRKIKGIFFDQKYFFKKRLIVEVDWISGVCLVLRSELLKAHVKFPEDYFMYAEDVAFGQEIQKFGKLIYFPFTRIQHGRKDNTSEYRKNLQTMWIQSLFQHYFSMQNKHFRSLKLCIFKLIFLGGFFLRLVLYSIIPNLKKTKMQEQTPGLKIYCSYILKNLFRSQKQ